MPLPPPTESGGGGVPVGTAIALTLGLVGVAGVGLYVTRQRDR